MRSSLHHKPREVDGKLYVTRQAARWLGVDATELQIRRAAVPFMCDTKSRAVYYELEALVAVLPLRVA